ncbi:MAG: hypothetical protein R3338_15450 [Thermoanaerobaculia bacterium]|nr:hypothetical protein [Thermoanaerobaculia bacterium]
MIRRDRQEAANLRLALELFEAGEQLKRQSLRRVRPDASDDDIESMIIDWLRTRPGATFGDCPGRRMSLEELGDP